jgi:predicted O-methyltransferase YrrM
MITAMDVQRSFGYLFEEEVKALRSLADSLSNGASILQIGAGAGTSSLAMLESKKPSVLRTIDIRNDDNPFGSLHAEKIVLDKAGFSHRSIQNHGDSAVLIPKIYGRHYECVDMAFIDGDHSYEGCKSDIHNCIEHALTGGGILAVHDYRKEDAYKNVVGKAPHPKPLPGVTKAVDELLIDKYEQILYVRSLIAFRIGDTK